MMVALMARLSVIVCTKDRSFELKRLLTSLAYQDVKLGQVIIVDGSDSPIESVAMEFKEHLPIEYFTLRPPGLTRQRNFGISKLKPGADWVGFLDDDLELETDCLKHLLSFIDSQPNLAGIGLRINDQRPLGRNLLREAMLLDLFPGGRVTLSGAAAPIRPYQIPMKVEWLYGGATFWIKSVLDQYHFDEWFSGVGYCEDLDFSYRVSRSHELAICAQARCNHYHQPASVNRLPLMGEWLVVAWWYFATVKNTFKPILVLYGILCMSINNLILSIICWDKRRFLLFKGNLFGLLRVFKGQAISAKGFQK